MKYRHGFVAVCISTSLILILLILWSNESSLEENVIASVDIIKKESFIKTIDSLLNFTDFNFLINSNPCDSYPNVSAVQIVTSFAGNVEARNSLRKAYPSSELIHLGVVRVFLLAALRPSQSDITQEDLYSENEKHFDIIQGNFFESYRNLTYKHIMGLKWASVYCSNVKFFIKMDDDILVNMYELMEVVEQQYTQNGFDLMGYILKNMQPIRSKSNKWYVKKSEFGDSFYPQFLSGWLYITTPKVATKLVSIAHTVPYFWIDDLFVTGILAKRANFTLTSINTLFSYHPELFECCIREKVKCGFSIGPNGGDHSLQTAFQEHAKLCFLNTCPTMPPKKPLEKTCVAKRQQPSIGKGVPHLKIIRL